MRKYDGVEKLTDNPYLNLYHIDARDRSGEHFDYYFASRNDEEHIKHKTHSRRPEGMAIYAVSGENADRLVLLRQYRYPLNDYIYELPAGLIEETETDSEAAVREMKEETGLTLKVYEGGQMYYRNAFYLAQGLSDESGSVVYGWAEGDVSQEHTDQSEDIEVILANKQEVRRILTTERVTTRAAFLMMQFLQAKDGEPFAFLDN